MWRRDPTPPEVRRRMREILEREEFRRSRSPLQRFWDWLMDRAPTPKQPEVSSGWGGPAANIILWVLVILLAVGLAFLISRVILARRPRPKREKAAAPTVDIDLERDADEWASDAERLEATGEWKEAMRCRYRELVARLVDLGAVSALAGRTTGELARDLTASVPAVAAPFTEATGLFELPWYAHADTGPSENARFRQLAAVVLATAESARELTGAAS